ncbi:hypothetical protein B7P33_08575 [Sediminicola luteus]|uniref:Curli production assembly/transport component CsgE n=2 Tax=Sediminicola luteus TaxID=319238 RepID=A0A2A4G999_9FLAO|nr:hypothetical protein B7P33_08575 [Sediminicola luteus]
MVWFCVVVQGFYAQETNSIAADINTKEENGFAVFTATVTNNELVNHSLRYVFSTHKNIKGTSDKSNSKQEGRFVLMAGEKREISVQRIQIEENERVIVLLLVYEEEELVAKNRRLINGYEGEEGLNPVRVDGQVIDASQKAEKQKDGIFLRGMVVEDTKTKLGREFYTDFYSKYRLRGINGTGILKIEEGISFGNTTQIEIKSDQELIFKFIVNPRRAYMEQMLEQALFRVNMFYKKKASVASGPKRY